MNNDLISGRLRGSSPLIRTSGKAPVSLEFSPSDIPAPKHTHRWGHSQSWVKYCSILGSLEYAHRTSLAVALSVSRTKYSKHRISSNRGAGFYGKLGVKGEVEGREGSRATFSHLLVLRSPNPTEDWRLPFSGC